MIPTFKCPRCMDQLTPLTTIIKIISDINKAIGPNATIIKNDKQVRRGMTSHRACKGCDLVYRVDHKKGMLLGNI